MYKTNEENIKNLTQCTDKTQTFTIKGMKIAKCTKVYDGDTIHMVMKLNETDAEMYRFTCRFSGINTPELKGTVEEHEPAVNARDFLAEKILNKIIFVNCEGYDKYGRVLGTIYLPADNWMDEYNVDISKATCINKMMIESGHAKEYFGFGAKE